MVVSHNVQTFPSGIIQLLINTKTRWCKYRRINDTTYLIGNSKALWNLEVDIPFKDGVSYTSYHMQDKDQISFIFVPDDLLLSEKQLNFKK